MPRTRRRTQTPWQAVCPLDGIERDRGVTALVHGQAVAIFRTGDDEVYAIGNHDPVSRTSVLGRGTVGMLEGRPYVASPAHRHRFDLATGSCLDDEHVSVPAYDVKVADGVVHVGARH